MHGKKFAAGLLAVVACLPAWHWAMSWREARLYTPRGEYFAGLHFYCQGTGEPAVIFEAGLGATYLDFMPIQKQVAQFTRACTYDRAGLGWSKSSSRPRTAQNAAAELLAALTPAGINSPVLVVAHSYGALVAESIAVQAPERLAGLILLDPSYPAEVRMEGAPSTALAPVLPFLIVMGAWRFRNLFDRSDPRYSPEADREIGALTNRSSHLITFIREIQALPESSHFLEIHFLETHAPRLTGKPVMILARGTADGAKDLASRHEQQIRLAHAFPQGRFEIIPAADHFIYLDNSEIVVARVREAVQAVRGSPRPAW
jgi:pimeloyl-ACP methyl ester carboxylesterase